MQSFMTSIYDMRSLDDLAQNQSCIHRMHALIKLITTVIYLTVVISFDKYEITGILPLVLYPIIILTLADIPAKAILYKLLLIEPFIIGIGILNPVFDNHQMLIFSCSISRGWITFISIFIKSALSITATILLVATTSMDKLANALRLLKIPRLFVLQLLLTYRYISVLTEELSKILLAYSLRAPNQKGINHGAWGSLTGQLILRTFERAERVYQSMCLRGFKGEYHAKKSPVHIGDLLYLFFWIVFFILISNYNIPMLIETFFTGVMG